MLLFFDFFAPDYIGIRSVTLFWGDLLPALIKNSHKTANPITKSPALILIGGLWDDIAIVSWEICPKNWSNNMKGSKLMSKILNKTAIALAVVTSLGFTGCIDSGDKSTMSGSTEVINKSTSGVITGFGSVFINGIEYETDGTTFVVNGVEGDESLLKLGMVVSLSGAANADGTGTAVDIEFDNEVKGMVLDNSQYSIDGTFNIMGLIIHTDEDTVFESFDSLMTDMGQIEIGNIVEISGYSAGDGSVWATRLEVKQASHTEGEEIEIQGLTKMVTDTTFMIGDMIVDYSSAVFDDDIVDAVITEGLFVEVKSELGLNANNALIAQKVELKGEGKKSVRHDADDDEVELQGVITKVISDAEIEINGVKVLLDANTSLIHGTAATLAEGLKVKVKGDVNVDGQLLASKLVFKPSGDIKLFAEVEATDVTANTIQVLGLTVSLNNYTMVEDDREDATDIVKYNFGVDDLLVGDWVEIKAYTDASSGLTALKMEREDFEVDDSAKLKGKIESFDAQLMQMVVAGVNVDYSAIAAEFIPEVGLKAELKGSYANALFTAQEGDAEADDEVYIGGSDAHEDEEGEHQESDGQETGLNEVSEGHNESDESLS